MGGEGVDARAVRPYILGEICHSKFCSKLSTLHSELYFKGMWRESSFWKSVARMPQLRRATASLWSLR